MKYEKMIQSILKEVGGQENIENVYHCATRLRFQLKDETKANDEAVKAIDGVLSIVKGGGQYQIVIGQHVADVYNELQTMMGTTENEIELKDAKEFKQEMKKKKISSQFIDVISGVFTYTNPLSWKNWWIAYAIMERTRNTAWNVFVLGRK